MTDIQRHQPVIRRATPAEATLLSELALRSKGYWGYSPEFLAACRDALTVTIDYIETCPVFVLEDQGRVRGFYGLRSQGQEAELSDLFVDPEAIGHGYGKRLWQHAVATARRLGISKLMIQSDPHAEGFYQTMGAVRIGESPSTVDPDRMLPLLCFQL